MNDGMAVRMEIIAEIASNLHMSRHVHAEDSLNRVSRWHSTLVKTPVGSELTKTQGFTQFGQNVTNQCGPSSGFWNVTQQTHPANTQSVIAL